MDAATTLMVTTFFILVVTVVSGSVHRWETGWSDSTGSWFAGSICVLAGALLVYLRVLIPLHPLVTVTLGNTLIIMGYFFHIQGFCFFLGFGRLPWQQWAQAAAAVGGITYFTLGQPNDLGRGFFLASGHLVLIVWFLFRLSRSGVRATVALNLIRGFLIFAVVLFAFWATRFLWLAPTSTLDLNAVSFGSAYFFLGVALAYIGLAFGEIMLLQEGLLGRQQQESEKALLATVALDKYMALQDRLVDQERDASVGRLIASVTHGLNTPLAALESATRSLDVSLALGPEVLLSRWSALDASQREWVTALNPKFSPGETLGRTRLKELRKTLDAAGCSLEPDLLVCLGLDRGEALERLLRPENRRLWTFLDLWFEPRLLGSTMLQASAKATAVINALQAWYPRTDTQEAPVTHLGTSLRNAVSRVSSRWFEVRIEGDTDRILRAPPSGLELVWTHLLNNASQALRGRGVVEVSVEGGRIAFTDHGPGVEASVLPLLFQPFISTFGAGQGVGLGLFLSRKFIEEWRGTLTFSTRPGETTFIVNVPSEPA